MILDRRAIDERPQISVQSVQLRLQPQIRLGIGDGGGNFQAVADDTSIVQQRGDLVLIITGDFPGISVIESAPVVVALVEDGFLTEPGLRSFQVEHLEQLHFIVAGLAPLLVVISQIARIGRVGRGAADKFGGHGRCTGGALPVH